MERQATLEASRARLGWREKRAAKAARKLLPLRQLIEHKRRQAAALRRSLNSGRFEGDDLRSARYAQGLFEAQLSKLESVMARLEKEAGVIKTVDPPKPHPSGASAAGPARPALVVGHRIKPPENIEAPKKIKPASAASKTHARQLIELLEREPLLAWALGILALLAFSVVLWR